MSSILRKEFVQATAVSPGFGDSVEGYLRLALVENEHRLRQAVRQIGRRLRGE